MTQSRIEAFKLSSASVPKIVLLLSIVYSETCL